MKRVLISAALALLGAGALPTLAAAQSVAYAVPGSPTNMRAGPGVDYPVVAYIRGGSAVDVYGCLSDFSWCDSSVDNVRGWVSTTRLEFEYAGDLVPIPRYYQYFEAPTIGFDFGYWDRYYQDEPFYRRHGHHRDGHHDRGSHRGDQIFPEEGGGQYDGVYRRRSRQSDQGGNRSDFIPPQDQIFPEEGGTIGQNPGDSSPRHRRGNFGQPPSASEGPPSSGAGDAGPPPPASSGDQGFGCPPDVVCQ